MTAADVDDRPHDLAAEKAVLGACMLSEDALAEAQNHVTVEDFHRPAHRDLFALLCQLHDDGAPTDPVSVGAALAERGTLLRIGGAPYLHTLIADVPTAANVGHHAEIVADRAARGRLLDAAMHIQQLVTQPAGTTPEVQESARHAIEAATAARAGADADAGVWLSDVVDDHIDSWDQPRRDTVPWPFADLNDVTDGMRPGQLIIIAGRPATGKSVVGVDCARHLARPDAEGRGLATLFVSLEMSRQDVIDRIVAAEAGVRLTSIKRNTLADYERERIAAVVDSLRGMPIRIEDRFSTSLTRLRSMARDCARSHQGLDLVVVDYLQLLAAVDLRIPRHEQVSAFSRGLKSLAKELAVPVVAMAQLNREVEKRIDKRPMLSDLRESGSLEQDADMVILMHRPDQSDFDSPRAGEADLILAKHRNGPTTTVTVAHQLHYSRFTDIARGA